MKVTTKGQVTIPAPIREYLGIHPHSSVDFLADDGKVILVKHEDRDDGNNRFSSMRGLLKNAPSTDQWMKETREA